MAAARKKKVGDVEPLVMRRIGHRHAVVTPPVETNVLDMNVVDVQLEASNRQIVTLEQKLAKLRARVADLRTQRAAFDQLPIDRVTDDPNVPLTPPEAQEIAAAEDAKRLAAARGGGG